MENLCVEDPGTCPYAAVLSPTYSHTSEYIVATASLWISVVLWLVGFVLLLYRVLAWMFLKQDKKKQGEKMFAPSLLSPDGT